MRAAISPVFSVIYSRFSRNWNLRELESVLRYALDKNTGELKYVDDVAKGKACTCLCPGCDWPVAAVHPEKNIRSHFRHLPEESTGNERPCGNPAKANESIVHIFVKNFIAAQSILYLPSHKIPTGIYRGKRMRPFEITPEKGWEITHQVVEDRTLSRSYVPDISCITDRGTLAIEVYCTNPVDEEKLTKMREDNLNVIEVNFSDFNTEMLGYTPIAQRLYDSRYTHWLNVLRSDTENLALGEWIQQEQKRIDQQIKLEEQARQRELEREQQIERAREELKFEAQIKNIKAALKSHATREFAKLLNEWDASPFLPGERQQLWDSVQSIKMIAEERLPKAKGQHHVLQSQGMTDRITKEIQEGVKRFRNQLAETLSKQYIERGGQRHIRPLYQYGWNGEQMNQPRKRENRGWQDYVDYEISSDFAPFLNEGMYRLGVRYARHAGNIDCLS